MWIMLSTFLVAVLVDTNTKNFSNICLHEEDFNLKANWTFL